MKRKPIVGETLYLKRTHRGGDAIPLAPVTVTKVGRKYFTVQIDWYEPQFEIQTWLQVTDHNSDYDLYETEKEYTDFIERGRIISFLRNEFGGWGNSKLPFETLRQVKEIIDNAKAK